MLTARDWGGQSSRTGEGHARMSSNKEQAARAAFRAAQQRWRDALEAHRLAPPDAGFSARLAALSKAATAEVEACREAEAAGFGWPPPIAPRRARRHTSSGRSRGVAVPRSGGVVSTPGRRT
jgi:hypothetical protein